MIVYNLYSKNEVNNIGNDTLTLMDYQQAKEMGYDTNSNPISHHTHDLKLHFLASVEETITPLTMFYYESSIVIICSNPDLYKSDVHQILVTASEILDLKKKLLVFITQVNFDALSALEEKLVTMSDDLNDDKDVSLQDIHDLKSICLNFSKYARRNAFYTETANDLDTKQLYLLTESINQYAQHLLDLTQSIIDTYNTLAQENNNATLSRLTLVTVFTTPFTVLAGIYGMNIHNLPWALHPYGFLILLGIMFGSSFLIFIFLKYKKVI